MSPDYPLNSKITYRSKNLKIKSVRITSLFSKKKNSTESRIDCMLANRGANASFSSSIVAWSIIEVFRNNVYGHFEQELKVKNRHMFYKIDISALICYFCEKSMTAHAALVLTAAFAPRFASMQAILDCGFVGKLQGNSCQIFKFLLLYVTFKFILWCVHILLSKNYTLI